MPTLPQGRGWAGARPRARVHMEGCCKPLPQGLISTFFTSCRVAQNWILSLTFPQGQRDSLAERNPGGRAPGSEFLSSDCPHSQPGRVRGAAGAESKACRHLCPPSSRPREPCSGRRRPPTPVVPRPETELPLRGEENPAPTGSPSGTASVDGLSCSPPEPRAFGESSPIAVFGSSADAVISHGNAKCCPGLRALRAWEVSAPTSCQVQRGSWESGAAQPPGLPG